MPSSKSASVTRSTSRIFAYEHVSNLRSFLLVLFGSTIGLIVSRLLYSYLHPDRITWEQFWTDWGAPIGLVYTVILTAIVVMLPSRLEAELKALAERIQSPLTDFSQVIERASLILEELGHRPKTAFKVVSASPILGLELSDPSGARWRELLMKRIEANCDTEIICLDPGTQFGPRSPLTAFCGALAKHYLKDPSLRKDLYEKGRKQIEEFQTNYAGRNNLKLKFGTEPGYQIIIARDETGSSKAILFFSSSYTLENNIQPSGFSTEDATMVRVLDMLFEKQSYDAKTALQDERTSLQRERDAELQNYHEERPDDYQRPVDEISPGYMLLVKREVFPPEIALAGDAFSRAIDASVEHVWKTVPRQDRLGIDIGTGTGVLALFLAKHCSKVVATDISEYEIANARENFQRFKALPGNTVEFETRDSNLLERVDKPLPGQIPLIVFNHPYYPSPANVFNIGGQKAGLALIEPFLDQAKAYLKNGGGVVMPYSQMAEIHNPVDVALRLKYKATLLTEDPNKKYGFHRIYLFTL